MDQLRIGDKMVEVDRFEEIGGKIIPVIKATATQKYYPDGRIDCTIHVPCLKIEKKLN
jgi:hypothetical protein